LKHGGNERSEERRQICPLINTDDTNQARLPELPKLETKEGRKRLANSNLAIAVIAVIGKPKPRNRTDEDG
jgi:hypothetical protein